MMHSKRMEEIKKKIFIMNTLHKVFLLKTQISVRNDVQAQCKGAVQTVKINIEHKIERNATVPKWR